MKLLIITQKVDIEDDLLGFFHEWIEEFALQCENVIVICLEAGKYDLPQNVKVLSMGKDEGASRIKYLYRFFKCILRERKNYDTVFVHMNPEYISLGFLFWKIFNKKISLWYTHKNVDFKLKLAEKLTDLVFTASRESFRIKSKKVRVVGHGINLEKFIPNQVQDDVFKIINVGRISPIKDHETIINAIEILSKKVKDKKFKVEIVGGAGLPEHEKYFEELKIKVRKKGLENFINFTGAIPGNKRFKYFNEADLFVHASRTGSLDKVFLEAMASGLLVLSSNDASKEILKNFGEDFIFKEGHARELADKIEKMMNMTEEEKNKIGKEFRSLVEDKHGLKNLIKKILKQVQYDK